MRERENKKEEGGKIGMQRQREREREREREILKWKKRKIQKQKKKNRGNESESMKERENIVEGKRNTIVSIFIIIVVLLTCVL